jgi:hypothetical protein
MATMVKQSLGKAQQRQQQQPKPTKPTATTKPTLNNSDFNNNQQNQLSPIRLSSFAQGVPATMVKQSFGKTSTTPATTTKTYKTNIHG